MINIQFGKRIFHDKVNPMDDVILNEKDFANAPPYPLIKYNDTNINDTNINDTNINNTYELIVKNGIIYIASTTILRTQG
jgi:hypothetical protein